MASFKDSGLLPDWRDELTTAAIAGARRLKICCMRFAGIGSSEQAFIEYAAINLHMSSDDTVPKV